MKRLLLTIIIATFLIGGCSGVQMSPPYRQTLEMSAINVAELNKRCQDGDAEACQKGLAEASKTLDLLVDALYGRK